MLEFLVNVPIITATSMLFFCGLQGSHSGHHVVVFSTTIFVVSVYDDDEENGKGKK